MAESTGVARHARRRPHGPLRTGPHRPVATVDSRRASPAPSPLAPSRCLVLGVLAAAPTPATGDVRAVIGRPHRPSAPSGRRSAAAPGSGLHAGRDPGRRRTGTGGPGTRCSSAASPTRTATASATCAGSPRGSTTSTTATPPPPTDLGRRRPVADADRRVAQLPRLRRHRLPHGRAATTAPRRRQAFLAAAHERGIKVIVDLVLNHTSSEHPWFKDSVTPGSAHATGTSGRTSGRRWLGPDGQAAGTRGERWLLRRASGRACRT